MDQSKVAAQDRARGPGRESPVSASHQRDVPATRQHDARVLADLGRREARRWWRSYVIGAGICTVLVSGGLIELGVSLPIGIAVALVWIAGVGIAGRLAGRWP